MLDGANRVAAALGLAIEGSVRVHVAFDYHDLLRLLLNGSVDVAWLAPITLMQALGKSAHLAAVCERDGRVTFRSGLLVRQSAPETTLGELANVRAAWVEESSAAGHVVPRLYLQRAGVTFARETFAGSYAEACAQVVRNEADVCAMFVHGDAPRSPLDALRLIGVTDSIINDGLVLATELTESERQRLTHGLLTLHETREGVVALQTLFQSTRLMPPDERFDRAAADFAALLAIPLTT